MTRLSSVFKGYKMEPLAKNGLIQVVFMASGSLITSLIKLQIVLSD